MKANHVRFRNAVRNVLGAVALGLLSLGAQAATWNKNTDFHWNQRTGNIEVFPGQGSGNIWTSGKGGAGATGPQWTFGPKQLPFNPSPTADFSAKFKPGDMAKAMMNPGSAIITLVGALALNRALDEACVRLFGGSMQLASGAQWEECKFKTESANRWRWVDNSGQPRLQAGEPGLSEWVGSSGAACEGARVNREFHARNGLDVTRNPSGSATLNYCNITTNEWQIRFQAPGINGWPAIDTTMGGKIQASVVTVETRDGYQAPVGGQAAVEAKLAAKFDEWSQADFAYGRQNGTGDAQKALDELIRGGAEVTVDSISGTGEPSKQGQPVTTTRQETVGGVTTTYTTITTTTNHYTYNNPAPGTNGPITITHTTTSTTTTTNNTNSNVTNTTTEKSEEPQEDCKENSQLARCAKLDTPETEIPKTTKNVDFTEDNLGLGGGSCPAPITFSTVAGSHTISYQPACDFATTILRPLLLAIAAMMAYFIAAGGIKEH